MLRHIPAHMTLGIILAVAPTAGADGPGDTGVTGRWQFAETPDDGFSDLVLEPGNIPWIISGNHLYYVDGERFHEVIPDGVPEGLVPRLFHGGPDRGAYISYGKEGFPDGLLHRLVDGEAEFVAPVVTNWVYPGSHSPVSYIYVSEDGSLFNHGARFVARFDGENWSRVEAKLHDSELCVFDLGDRVYFYYPDNLYMWKDGEPLKELKPPAWDFGPSDRPAPPVGMVWAGRRALLFREGQPGLFAFDLETLEPVPITDETGKPVATPMVHAFERDDGSVWFYGRTKDAGNLMDQEYGWFRLSPEGTLASLPGKVRGDRFYDSRGSRRHPDRDRMLAAPDGLIWLTLRPHGVGVYDGRELREFTWEDGITSRVRNLTAETDGDLWCGPIAGKLAVFRKGETPAGAPVHLRMWEVFPLADGETKIWEGRPGELLMFRRDRPGELCRWDGWEWTYQPFQGAIRAGQTSASDRRGRFMISVEGNYEKPWRLFEPDGRVREFADMREALETLADEGSGGFAWDEDFLSCRALDDGRMLYYQWYYRPDSELGYYDGRSWTRMDPLRVPHESFTAKKQFGALGPAGFLESYRYDPLLRAIDGSFYTFRSGEAEPLVPCAPPVLMLGPGGFQPYEREMVEQTPDRYLPVRGRDGLYSIEIDPEAYERQSDQERLSYDHMLELDTYAGPRVVPSRTAGCWVVPGSRRRLLRILDRQMIVCDMSDTPAETRQVYRVAEDAAGDVWYTSFSAFACHLSQLSLAIDDLPMECTREWRPNVRVEPDIGLKRVRVLSRIDGGSWDIGSPGEIPVFRFHRTGEYDLDLALMHVSGGIVPASKSFSLRVFVEFPETRLAEKGPFLLDDTVWRPPIELVATSSGGSVSYLWRTDGGEWQPPMKNGRMAIGTLSPGTHQIQLAAVEEDEWRDPTPLTVEVRYTPDFESIVRDRLETLFSLDKDAAEEAFGQVRLAGPGALDELEKQIKLREREFGYWHLLNDLERRVAQEIERSGAAQGKPNP